MRADIGLSGAELWLPSRRSDGAARGRLIILPHAGCGTAQWFRWSDSVPVWIEVRVARLPGRESRLAEPVITEPEVVTAALAEAIEALPPLPTVLFGHSLGAHLAYSLCHRLPHAISGLIVSGSSAPGRRTRERLSGLSDVDLAESAQRRWNAIPQAIQASAELRALFLPALRGDLALAENWPAESRPPLEMPLVVVAGDADPEISASDLDDWYGRTLGPSSLVRHDAGHMDILADPALARRVVAASIELMLE